IKVLHRMPNIMTDQDSLIKVICLVIGRVLSIIGDEIAITPILINSNHPLVREDLLKISQPLLQVLVSDYPLSSHIDSVILPLKLESQAILNLHFPKSKLYQNADAQLIRFSVQTVLDILVAKYVAGIREKTNLDLAMMDPLLRIPGRRSLDKTINDYQGLDTLKTIFPVSVMIIDLDHFKKVNDTYGHGVGDEVLQHVAAIIRGECAAYGTQADVFRMGGEELACIVRSCDEQDAMEFAKRINRCINNTPYSDKNQNKISQTVSIGIATAKDQSYFNSGSADKISVMEMADLALYAAKGKRNEVITFVGDHLSLKHTKPGDRRSGSRQGV
ncbi:GGDEF domain-containing protein, partial [Candidatus Gracilibacteria bacterium]|nr:GGDEF domain-containing protein [Candidatus Gracilibacteria bacterium]